MQSSPAKPIAALIALAAALALDACESSDTPPATARPGVTTTAPSPAGAGAMSAAAGDASDPGVAGSGAAGSAEGPAQPAASGAGAGAPAPAAQAGSGGAASAGQDAPAELASYRAELVVPDVEPNEEGTVCVQVRLDNADAIHVVRLHNTLSSASHHFIVSKVTDPSASEQALAPCAAFRGAIRGAPLAITQKHDDEIVLPDGVAYELGASQLMNLELHYLNVGSEPVDVKASTELFAADGAALQEATIMLIGTAHISVGPHTTASSGVQYTALPAQMEGVHFFAITGHTHRFGTNVQVSSAAGPGRPGTVLYAPEPFVWDAPEMKHLDPAVQVPAGGGFNLECEWNNPSEQTITFGESALQEMCFFWAYYYPKKPVTNVLLDGRDISAILGRL